MDDYTLEALALSFFAILFLLFLSYVNKSNLEYAHDNIEEYTQLYNECESNFHTEKTMSHICVNEARYKCLEFQDKEIEIKVYDVSPNDMTCEEIVSSYNNMTRILENEKKQKNK